MGNNTDYEKAKAQPKMIDLDFAKVRIKVAAMAMQGILASEPCLRALSDKAQKMDGNDDRMNELVAKEALYYADALIAELRKGEK